MPTLPHKASYQECIWSEPDFDFLSLQKGSGLWPATYTLIPATEGNEKCLDPNHTHFLLVDNGTTNQNGLEVKFRDELERQIANTKTGNSQGSLYEK